MSGAVRRLVYSRVVWILGVAGVVWVAADIWHEGLSEGFTARKTFQAVIASLLAILFSGAFVTNRAWRKQTRESD